MSNLPVTGQVTVNGTAYPVAGQIVRTDPVSTATEFRDFTTSRKSGLALPTKVDGKGTLIYRMVPNTSTKGSIVAAIPKNDTNPYTLVTVGGASAGQSVTGIDLSHFLLDGTEQGHSYNGLRVEWSNKAWLHDLFITGIPGKSSTPPEETFSANFWHANGVLAENVRIDGENIAASLFGLNGCDGATLKACEGVRTKVGFCFTSWKSGDVVVEDFIAAGRKAFNCENPSGPQMFVRPDLRGAPGLPHMTCNTQGPAAGLPASVPFIIHDPILANWPLKVGVITNGTKYLGSTQTQKASDVRLFRGGKEVTNDPSQLQVGQVWP